MDATSEIEGKPFPEDLPSLLQRFSESVESRPNELAIVCTHQPADLYGVGSIALEDDEYRRQPYLRWSYRSLDRSIDQLASALARQGLTKGTPVFVFLTNTVEYVLVTWAAYRLGCVHVPINPRNLVNKEEVKHMVGTVTDSWRSKSVAILAGSDNSARQIDGLALGLNCMKIVVDGPVDGWISFEGLMKGSDEDFEIKSKRLSLKSIYAKISRPTKESESSSSDTTVLFTSGTTSLPKACLIRGSQYIASLEWRHSMGAALTGDVVAVVVPNNHAIAYICLMTTFTHGATVVFPGPAFEPQAMMDAMQREKCTHTTMVPTMVHALMGVKPRNGRRLDSLKGVMLAGTLLTPEILRSCFEDLGASSVENMYGMTEGVLVSTANVESVDAIVKGEDVAIGMPAAGSKIRICSPGEQTPLPRGVPGELHFSGRQLITEYIGKKSDDFYQGEDGVRWFITGDQAVLDHDARLYIVGRYRDMIIRGGENISPAAIETVLAQTPELRALDSQIVGAKDAIAGEVPIAVVNREIQPALAKQLQDTILAKMGTRYIPHEVLPLQSLGLEDYPRTLTGKVQKTKLAELVRKYLEGQDSAVVNASFNGSILEDTVKRIWARMIGLDTSQLDVKARVSEIADSITVMSVREKVRKETGRNVPLSEWAAVETISNQIELIQKAHPEQKARPIAGRREGPPEVEDMAHLGCDPALFDATRDLIEKTVAQYQLSWNDVEDVMPATGFVQTISRTRLIDTWNIRTSVLAKGADSKQLGAALAATLANNPLLRSFLVCGASNSALGPEMGLYVVIRQTKELLDRCIFDHGTVRTLDDVRKITMEYPYKDHAMMPGPLCRAIIVFVEETKSAVLIYNAAHAILDATYQAMIHEDLDRALSGQPLSPRVPFKAWADSYHALRTSPVASAAVDYHAERLGSFRQHRHALWPLSTPTLTVSPEREAIDGHFASFSAPGIIALQRAHPGLTAPIVLKAATALLALHHTNHTHALFASLEAVRARFPFVPASLNAVGSFEATDVAGPTFNCVVNLLDFRPEETVLQFLRRMQDDQASVNRHASVPWHELARRLGPPAEEVLPQVADTLLFNWMPGLGAMAGGANPHVNMQVTQVHIRTKLGMLANVGMGGKDGSTVVMLLQGGLSNTSTEGITAAAEGLRKISTWLAEKDSWDLPVGRFRRCLDAAN